MADINPKWDEYILWLATPEHQRGTITSEEAWAKANGISAKTTRRWRINPDFVQRQMTLTKSLTAKVGAVAVFEDDESTMNGEERDYRVVKSKLIESAKTGNLKAQELFMKIYGKTWVDEEQASRVSDFGNMDTEELVAKAALAVNVDILVKHLVELGYKVEAPTV